MSPTPFKDSFWGPNGFEDVRKRFKKGEDLYKELTNILQERAELEVMYAKGLAKLATKTNKVSREMDGTTSEIWQTVANTMENESETHRHIATAVSEEVIKPLKTLVDNQHKTRKVVETGVDKISKSLIDRRSDEHKAKKLSFACTQEKEKVYDLVVDARLGRGKPVAEKDIAKFIPIRAITCIYHIQKQLLETKCKKTEKALNKADQEYYSACLKAEKVRQECESFVAQGGTCFQQLEEERLVMLKDIVGVYAAVFLKAGPQLAQLYDGMHGKVVHMDIQGDLQAINQGCQADSATSRLLLPDFYAEDLFNAMKKERRKELLEKILNMVKNDLEQKKHTTKSSKNGTKSNLDQTPTAEVDGRHVSHSELYLEATIFKIQCSLADLEGFNRPTHYLTPYIEQQSKDKQGMMQTVLKLPMAVAKPASTTTTTTTAKTTVNPASTWTTPFDTNHDLLFNDDIDFSDVRPPTYLENKLPADPFSPDHVYTTISARQPEKKIGVAGQCRAIYNYEANLSDELTLQSGDIITIYDKSNNSWWKGELNGVIGLFPATYVEEIS